MKKTKNVLLVIAFALSAIFAKAQTSHTYYTPEAVFDSTMYDQNGTRFFLSDLKIDTVT
jgi:hypothetical protein